VTIVDAAICARLTPLYGAPDRHYHGMAHIEALLALAGAHRVRIADPEVMDAAIWFHDAIYDSRRKDNEARSAELAREWLAGRVSPERLRRITTMIEATATHRPPALGDADADSDAALFLDMDLSILGAGTEAFDAYERAIRAEYAWVEETAWRIGRAALLNNFLGREHIYQTELFRQTLENRARANIERSIAALSVGT